ncbi:hypothetical protein PVAP13_9KG165752 [Panicum virgatum]|uniref:Uncharacterized protein n=1 Tax=Panicum virgatum TaxID=38727 RepID=A0A8T0NPX0_PANVG|nr:hypothetical protein PVAP13_9KG165752 [Panicum virgatum]
MISLEFPGQQEVILFQGRGYNKDQFGAELVFYVNLVNKPGWSSVIALKPRDLFAMPEFELEDSIDVSIEGINLLGGQQDLTNWTRSDKEGTTGDVSVITQVQVQAVDEPDDAVFDVDDEDDTYINDGVVAPVSSVV